VSEPNEPEPVEAWRTKPPAEWTAEDVDSWRSHTHRLEEFDPVVIERIRRLLAAPPNMPDPPT
jgi:hypothetical protein